MERHGGGSHRRDSHSGGSHRGSFGGGSRGGSHRGDSFGGGSHRGPRRDFDRPREMHKATCADCGEECEVPFKPTEGRDVFCKECYRKKRSY